MNYLELSLIGVILLYPLFDFFTGKFKSKNKNVEYLKICIFLWGLTSFLAYVYYIEMLSVNELDYLVEFNWQNLVAITLILIAVVYLMLLIKSIISNEKLRLEVANKFVPYIDLMPTNKSQVLVFTLVLSVTAGTARSL